MSSKTHQRILTFIKKYKDELSPTTGIDEFADLLNECFSFKQDASRREKVNLIVENLVLDDESKLVEGDLQKYVERLIDFVEGPSDDPLEKNNLKQRSSSGSSDEEDNRGHNRQQNKHKRDRSRDREKNKKSKKNQKNTNILSELQKAIGKDMNIKDLLSSLTNTNNRKQQHNNNNKNVVFLQNVPREMRSYTEIEALLQGRGELIKIQLLGRVPSVQFKNHSDAQALIDKFIVHKGVKIEFTQSLNKQQQHQDDNKNHKIIILDKEGKKVSNQASQPAAPLQQTQQQQQQQQQQSQQQSQQQQAVQKQDSKMEEETDQKKTKEEQELNNQIDQIKGQAKTLVVDKVRLALLLNKRKDNYSPQLSAEIDELKKQPLQLKLRMLTQKKEEISKMNSLEQLKAELQWLNENYDYTLLITQIPEQLFKEKTVTKVLNEEFQKYGKIDNLQIKIKDKAAHLKFFSFDSAEKAYYQANENSNFKVEFLNQGIKKVLIAQS
ncbi:unnamed protein product (macronuclear) [Paramecium tetraurelia]|uniref:RRM domain-containing protein n=1 Tax=Paramecium tetraurelia TaxID=5888 RepID=A0D6W8_PARTE|nr:uncharacterized protein GSPATT00001826001 [Paramecium tetraurelia]CAK78785.1 unnamed protein product [Paramecium tetraurelia]|eukprot:XP_001446182.1 hypothetical protein (macronuclear) [Paramecium tetraurelia strain d4-2]